MKIMEIEFFLEATRREQKTLWELPCEANFVAGPQNSVCRTWQRRDNFHQLLLPRDHISNYEHEVYYLCHNLGKSSAEQTPLGRRPKVLVFFSTFSTRRRAGLIEWLSGEFNDGQFSCSYGCKTVINFTASFQCKLMAILGSKFNGTAKLSATHCHDASFCKTASVAHEQELTICKVQALVKS